jgi:hypothetical protein
MKFIGRRFIRERRLAAAAAAGALALAAPIPAASAATTLFGFRGVAFAPIAFPFGTTAFSAAPQGAVGVNQLNGPTAVSGCGSNRPSTLGSAGGTTAESCIAVLSFIGPAIGQINSQVGPTIIGSTVLAPIVMTGGNTVTAVP